MLQQRTAPFVCQRCLAQGRLAGQASPFRTLRPPIRHLATVQHAEKPPPRPGPGPFLQGSRKTAPDIRSRLRAWECANPGPEHFVTRDVPEPGSPTNSLARTQTPQMVEAETDPESQNASHGVSEGDDLVDLRSSATDVRAGDLIEISADAWRIQLLAVCLGEFGGYQHFYTNNGKWFTSNGAQTLFQVREFASADELRPVVEALPSTSASAGLLHTLQDLKAGPSRDRGAPLIRKMNEFQNDARYVYQANATRLDSAYRHVSGLRERAAPLAELAEALLHPSHKKKGVFSPTSLYAVHRALALDDVGFQPASHLAHAPAYFFRVSGEADVATVRTAEDVVQRYHDSVEADANSRLEGTVFGRFVLKARKAVDDSRRSRGWTPHGMLGPSRSPASPILPGWDETDRELIRFVHMWATDKFGRSARHHWAAAAILRALDRYGEAEYLEPAVAWTFLQEIGWLRPWEIQARYKLSLPGVQLERGAGVKSSNGGRDLLAPDVFAGRRKSWAAMTFCIDAESAADIDDGIALERTETAGQYWIHVHVADPASSVRVGSPLAEQAALVPQTTYLPGHFSRMLDHDAVRELFSLAPGARCLTFSGLVDERGTLLDYEVTPGVLGPVTYMTPEAASEVCNTQKTEAELGECFAVGTPPSSQKSPSRTLTSAQQLSAEDADTLRTLSRLADALQARRVQRGAVPVYLPSPAVEVAFDGVQVDASPDGFARCSGDPYICVSYGSGSGNATVSSAMQLAGEVAARWCYARGVPIPYRVQPRAGENADRLMAYCREVLYPQLLAGQRPSAAQWQTARALSGGHDMASAPAPPLAAMGVGMYAKATSPLRRYADLVVHWQVHAALQEEERRGGARTLISNSNSPSDDSFLPFSRAALDRDVLPMLRLRERHGTLLDRAAGPHEWMLQALVRAWKFGEASSSPLPSVFRFVVADVAGRRLVRGQLDWFERPAVMDAEGLAGVRGTDGRPLTVADVEAGDVFGVELADVVVCQRKIVVRAVGREDTIV